MVSLIVWGGLLLSMPFVFAAAITWAARAVGSPRGRFKVGVASVFMFLGVSLAVGLANLVMPTPKNELTAIALGVVEILVQLVVAYLIYGAQFQLSPVRAFAPLAVHVAANIGYVILALAVLRPMVSQSFVMPAGGMAPTLQPGDRFFVNKLARLRRWDLVAYRSIHSGAIYIKRLVGLPGEQLRFENGQLYVNGQLQPAPAVIAGRLTATLPRMTTRYRDGQAIQLGPTETFLVGDDLDNSIDSRLDGPTDRSDFVGVADLRYWPAKRISLLR